MTRLRRLHGMLPFLAALLFAAPHTSRAQAGTIATIGGLDQLFSRIESINIYYGGRLDRPTDADIASWSKAPWKRDYGVEFGFHLGSWSWRDPGGAQPMDTTEIVVVHKPGGDETSVKMVPKERKVPPLVEFDLGLGWGQLDKIEGFHQAYDVHGSVRELPSVSVYWTYRLANMLSRSDEEKRGIALYQGAKSGLIQLQDAQVTRRLDGSAPARDTISTLSGDSFQIGIVPLGVDIPVAGMHFTTELAWTTRRFGSLNYADKSVPADYPQRLNFTAWSLEMGVQLPLPAKK